MDKYLNGEIDWARSVPASRIDEAKQHPDYFVQPYLGTYFYGFNTTVPPFDNAKVRQAFTLAVNRERICRDVLKAGEIPATGYCPPGLHGYEPVTSLRFDPLAASKLLALAGYPGGKGFPEVELLYNNSESHKMVAEAVADMWQNALGVTVKLRNKEWKVYLDDVQHLRFQVVRRGWIGDYGDPNTFLDMFVTGGGNNNTGWANSEFDARIQRAAAIADPAARMQVLREAEQMLLDEAPILPIYFYVNKGFISPTVGGWYPNIRDLHPFQYLYITE
jgi:oligopeptide transport system substrate-binding protein